MVIDIHLLHGGAKVAWQAEVIVIGDGKVGRWAARPHQFGREWISNAISMDKDGEMKHT